MPVNFLDGAVGIEENTKDEPHVTIKGEIIDEIPNAILFHDGCIQTWLPLSYTTVTEGVGKHCVVHLPEWLAKTKGLLK